MDKNKVIDAARELCLALKRSGVKLSPNAAYNYNILSTLLGVEDYNQRFNRTVEYLKRIAKDDTPESSASLEEIATRLINEGIEIA